MNINKRYGISLIVLVITIIVIVILAVAVILTIANNNPIENANKATFQNDLKTIQEDVRMYDITKYSDETIAGREYSGITTNGENMVNLFPSSKNYKDKIDIIKGEVKVTSNVTEQEKIWANEIGIEVSSFDLWDGTVDTTWYEKNPKATTFNIYTAEELAGIAQIVKDGTDYFKNKTIYLMNDINLNGENYDWMVIDDFSGNFNGRSHEISNMRISSLTTGSIGLFGYNCWRKY